MIENIILDASSIICIKEIKAQNLFKKICKCNNLNVIIPNAVYVEINRKTLNKLVINMVKKGFIKKSKPPYSIYTELKRRYPRLGVGELEAIAIAKSNIYQDCIIIFDDSEATKTASKLNLVSHGLIWFLKKCFLNKILTKEEVLTLLLKIEKSNFRIKPSIIKNTKRSIEKYKI